MTETFPGAGIDPTRLTALNYRTQSGPLAPYLSVELFDPSAAAGHQYQNLVWTPGNVAGTPAITPGTWQDWDTSTGGWVARYNVGGLTAGTAYQLTAAEATAKATDPALLAIRASVVYGDTNYGGPYANTTAYVDGLSLGLDGTTTDYDVDNRFGQCQVIQDTAAKTLTMLADCSTAVTLTLAGRMDSRRRGPQPDRHRDGRELLPGRHSAERRHVHEHPQPVRCTRPRLWDNAGKNSGGDLAGIKFLAASGSVTNTTVDGISHGNGVQEGKAILVDNRTHPLDPNFHAFVTLDNVTVTDFQKAGVDIRGDVNGRLTNSVVGQSASPSGVRTDKVTAANSVVVAYGANAVVSGNTITGNDWDGNTDWNATALLGYQAGNLTVSNNVFNGPGTDVGVDVESSAAVVVTCNLIGRSAEDAAGIDVWDTGLLSSGNAAVDVEGNTFAGWRDDTAGVVNHTGGACAAAAPAVSVSDIHTSSASVSWTPATALPYAPVSGWQVVTPDGHTIDLPASSRSFDLTGLPAGAAQTVQVLCDQRRRGGCQGHGQLHHTGRLRYGARGLGGRGCAGRVGAGAVTGIAVSDLSDNGFTLTWNPANGATSYEVNVGGVVRSVSEPLDRRDRADPEHAVPGHGQRAQCPGQRNCGRRPCRDESRAGHHDPPDVLGQRHNRDLPRQGHVQGDRQARDVAPGRLASDPAASPAQPRVDDRRDPDHQRDTGWRRRPSRRSATAYYRVVTSTSPAVTGGSIKVNVRSAVSYRLSATHATRSSRITVTGSASPQVAGARVVVQRKVGNKWITLTHTVVSKKNRYTASVLLTAAGSWQIRVLVAARHGYLTGVGATRTVTVR